MSRHIAYVLIAVVVALALLAVSDIVKANAATKHVFVADYIDRVILKPYHSVITGDMLVHNRDVHGIPIVDQLVLLKIETNFGSATAGQPFTGKNNFGCVKYFAGRTSLLGKPVPGTFSYWGSRWYSWKTPAQGMCGWGRFVEHWGNGSFLKELKRGNWKYVAKYYNGGSRYEAWCRTLDAKYTKMFKDNGYPLTAKGWTP